MVFVIDWISLAVKSEVSLALVAVKFFFLVFTLQKYIAARTVSPCSVRKTMLFSHPSLNQRWYFSHVQSDGIKSDVLGARINPHLLCNPIGCSDAVLVICSPTKRSPRLQVTKLNGCFCFTWIKQEPSRLQKLCLVHFTRLTSLLLSYCSCKFASVEDGGEEFFAFLFYGVNCTEIIICQKLAASFGLYEFVPSLETVSHIAGVE